jgi:glycosyltransferase involved in cell wall biosynthesis
MRIGMGAIFRNEADYIIEWLAWHRLAGFKDFFIADNGSTDGSTQILEALAERGVLRLVYAPPVGEMAQVRAYNRITESALEQDIDALLFLDADEFLVHENHVDGQEMATLLHLLKKDDVGMCGINWRCFGSSGKALMAPNPVVERFTHIASDFRHVNNHIKSVSKLRYVKFIGPHHSTLIDKRYIKSDGTEIDDFIVLKDGVFEAAVDAGRVRQVASGPLRVNHYVVKSKEEFENKRRRGCSMRGIGYTHSPNYFEYHDFRDEEYYFPASKIDSLKLEIIKLQEELDSSLFGRELRGSVDVINKQTISGWLVDKNGLSNNLKVNIFVNDIYQGSSHCKFYRPDVLGRKISLTGMCGFRWTHVTPLNNGDTVRVEVHANRHCFPNGCRSFIRIE